jgi:hypothetical protein
MKYLLVVAFVMFGIYKSSAQNTIKTTHKSANTSRIKFPPPIMPDSPPISIDSASKYLFNWVTITAAKVYGYHVLKHETRLYLGADYPNQLLTVVLTNPETRRLARNLKNKVISVRGRILTDNDRLIGKPIMPVVDTSFIKIVKQ